MPELVEVESIRRFVAPLLEGSTVRSIAISHPRMVRYQPRPSDVANRLENRRIRQVRRHGKVLIADLEGHLTWLTHLGMSGRIQVVEPTVSRDLHTHVVADLSSGLQFRMVDPRTFGYVVVLTPDELAESSFARLGPDALDALPTVGDLCAALEGRQIAVKSLLLDQRFVAGLGNIYADEVLYRAGVRGDRPAGSLSTAEVRRLRNSTVPVLRDGLRWNGTSLSDLSYVLPDGRAGDFAARLNVYGREDEPCPQCGTPIRRNVIGARSSFWCPGCQQ